MVNLYADLVMAGRRSLDPNNEEGIPVVPALYREKVKAEVERRMAAGEFSV